MRLCVRYAISFPERVRSNLHPLDLASIGKLTFNSPDLQTFTLLPLAYYAADYPDGVLGAVLNGANERAVELFLSGKIGFTDIFDIVERVVRDSADIPLSIENVFYADSEARESVNRLSGI